MGSETASEWQLLWATQHPSQAASLPSAPTHCVHQKRLWGLGDLSFLHPRRQGREHAPVTVQPQRDPTASRGYFPRAHTPPLWRQHLSILCSPPRSHSSWQRVNRTGGHGHALEVFMDFALYTEIQRWPPIVCHFLLSHDILKVKLNESAVSHLFWWAGYRNIAHYNHHHLPSALLTQPRGGCHYFSWLNDLDGKAAWQDEKRQVWWSRTASRPLQPGGPPPSPTPGEGSPGTVRESGLLGSLLQTE